MLITKDFVLLNMPKTGSTFAREIINELYEQDSERFVNRLLSSLRLGPPGVQELLLPEPNATHLADLKTQHGTYEQIPPPFRGRKIVTITRNPFSRYVSAYRFGFWKHHWPADEATLRQRYESYPELSFADWYDMSHRFSRGNRLGTIEPQFDIGLFSVQFVQFYFPDPRRTLGEIDGAWLKEQRYRQEMPDITFLHQERLNDELRDFLSGFGFSQQQLDAIHKMQHANVTGGDITTSRSDVRTQIGEEIIDLIRERERFLFQLFPEYDLNGELSDL